MSSGEARIAGSVPVEVTGPAGARKLTRVDVAGIGLEPARIFGIADRYGTLEPGKDADVVVWSGDPFELTTLVEHVFIKGREMPADTRQRELLQRYRTLDATPPAYKHP